MKVLILYSSKTGFSKRYAQWLAEALNCPAIPFKDRKSVNGNDYEKIILFGGLYADQMSGLKWLKSQLPELSGKGLAAVAVGCTPAEGSSLPENIKNLFDDAPGIKGFYCQGGLDYEHMGAIDRAMMAALRSALKRKPEMSEMLKVISHSFDGTKREYLDPVIRWVREA